LRQNQSFGLAVKATIGYGEEPDQRINVRIGNGIGNRNEKKGMRKNGQE